jgi:integrase
MLISVARHEVKVGDKHLEALQAFCKRLDDGSPGMSDKNKTRLRQFDDPQHVWDLLGLPQALLDKAKKEVKREAGVVSQAAALRYQTALAIELLLMIPMRRENLTRLTVEKHIDRRRNGTALIIIPGTEVKNGVSIEAALPAHVIKMLDDYMKAYQPVLAKGASPWVFPGLPGRPKSRERMAFQVSETIKKEIGLQMHMHLFRHFAAKIYLDRNPGGYGVVQKLHGHKSIETTIRSYCGAEVKSAISHYDHQILKLRDEDLSNPKKPRG